MENDTVVSSYLDRWENEITQPLMEWNRSILEARLNQAQIDSLFGDVEQNMSGEKTSIGKGLDTGKKVAKVAVAALPTNLAMKIHDMIKDSEPVKNFNYQFEWRRTRFLDNHPKFEKLVDELAYQAETHPKLAAAVIGILTTATALATGGAGGLAIGALLKTSLELLKGEFLSTSIAKGLGVGALGALAALPISEIGDWLTNFDINAETVPGYKSLLKVTLAHQSNGVIDLSVDTYMPKDIYAEVNKLMDTAATATANGDYREAAQIYQELNRTFSDPSYIDNINAVITNNDALVDKTIESAKKTASVFDAIAAAVQGGVTGAASKKSRNLYEADIKSIANDIARWAKTKASTTGKELSQTVTVKKLITAWDKAGRPTDSDAIHNILLSAGVPESVLQDSFTANNIPLPKKRSKPRAEKQVQISTGDATFDQQINNIIATKGKDAAVQYLMDLKAKAQAGPVASSKHGNIRTASDNQNYKLDVGKNGDRIWFNVQTGDEASTEIDNELEGVPSAKPAPAAKTTPQSTIANQAFRQRAAAAKAAKRRPVREALLLLNEAKARIDHPEDLVIDEGAAGAKRALNAMISLVNRPRSVTIKMDGSPALIFGWDEQGFVLTDKSGFGAKGYDGMTRSAEAVTAMLRGDTGRRIKDTSPEGMAVRDQYAKSIAGLYNMLKALVPQSLAGYLQGDLLWQGTPALVDGNYEFGPLKIKYKIPANTELGKQIGSSQAGIVIHSMFETRDDQEPSAIDNINDLNLNTVPGLVVIPHELNIVNKLELPTQLVSKLNSAITAATPLIDRLFDGTIKSLPTLMKSYLAWKAGKGSSDFSVSPNEFIEWLDSPASKATDSMRKKVKEHLDQNIDGYHAIWQLIQSLNAVKLYIKQQLDKSAESTLSAEFSAKAHPELQGKGGHEGFVADTEHGKIKLVNRSEFMRKHDTADEPLNEYATGGASAAGSVASVANPFGFTISRTPNLFGYIPEQPKKKKAKRKAPKYP